MIKVRLQFAERDRIILDGHIRRNELLSVASFDAATQIQVFRRCTPELPIPMHAGAAHTIAEDEGTILPIRGRDVVRAVTDRDSLLGQRLPKITSDAVLEFVRDPWELKIGGRVAGRTAFKRHYGQTGIRESLRQNGAGPSIADDDRVHALFALSHQSHR